MPKRLPKLPTMLWSAGGPVRIRRAKDLRDEDEVVLDGEWRPQVREVLIHADLAPEAAWHVLGHEMTHAWLDDGGFREAKSEVVERVCDAVANGLALNLWMQGSRGVTG